ncbi:HET domain protein [Aspergillus clavatus NRRL 1]|uniref:HET domain protein n=1 Tax=Aspergillus clavatus (strain ATCC 1007 / CBS 513.65 / DSM 816 / NCTC 3887 / NRRL 1 / QM 1276 / 107) TaxID=344612 RepID=A1C8M1_ASPCL|nr:HET domain protein [Aspergillus clavatus NRRL 1]EAW13658.1 HET domain protein [Aspergillus clavatus NRRL 1]
MKQETSRKGATTSSRPTMVGWSVLPGVGEGRCTQFEVVVSDDAGCADGTDESTSHHLHSPAPLKVVKHTAQGGVYTTIAGASFKLGNKTLDIVLRAHDGAEWSTSMVVAGERLLVPAQQEKLAELFIALSAICNMETRIPANMGLSAEGLKSQTCAAPFCDINGLVCTHDTMADSQIDKEHEDQEESTYPSVISYTDNEQLWIDGAPQSSAAMMDLLTNLVAKYTIRIADTCHAQDADRKILLSDNIIWWLDETTEELPQRKHDKPANWGGFQDMWRNHKNLRESKKRAAVVVETEARPVHGSVIKFAQAGEPDRSAMNPLRLVQVQTREVIRTVGLEKKRYAIISYTWSQFTKEELLEWATARAAKLGYEYIWIDQYCIDQTDKKEKNGEIKRMRDYYKNAAQVLVLLPDVTSLASFDVVSTDQLIHVDAALNASRDVLKEIASCQWLKRVWTFQEAWVARQCVFCTQEQMLDGTVMDSLSGLLKYQAVNRPKLMCVASKSIGNPVVANPNTVVWDGVLRQRQTVVGSTDRWALQSGFNEYEPPRLTLVQAWEASKGRDTMNEEDRVYALLSSVEGGDRVKVDRGRSLMDVIQDCVEAGIVGADLLAGNSPSTVADRCWMPDLTGSGPQHPLRVAGADERQQPLTWQGGRVSVKGKIFGFADLSAWLRIAKMRTEDAIQQSEASDRPWLQFASTTRQKTWTTKDVVGSDFFLVQAMPGSMQTVLVAGKKRSDGSFHRRKGHIVWLKETGEEWLRDSQSVEVGAWGQKGHPSALAFEIS